MMWGKSEGSNYWMLLVLPNSAYILLWSIKGLLKSYTVDGLCFSSSIHTTHEASFLSLIFSCSSSIIPARCLGLAWSDCSKGQRNQFGYRFYIIGVFWSVVVCCGLTVVACCVVVVPVGWGVGVTRLVVPPLSMLVFYDLPILKLGY